jgi:hypothetical protein
LGNECGIKYQASRFPLHTNTQYDPRYPNRLGVAGLGVRIQISIPQSSVGFWWCCVGDTRAS